MGKYFTHPADEPRRKLTAEAERQFIADHAAGRNPNIADYYDKTDAEIYADSLATGGLRKVQHIDEYSGSRMHTFEPVNPRHPHPMSLWMDNYKLKPLRQIRINNCTRSDEENTEFEQAWREQQRALGNKV